MPLEQLGEVYFLAKKELFTGFSRLWSGPLLSTLFILALAALLTITGYRLFFHPLSRLPGPFLAKITGEWRNHRFRSGQWDSDVMELHKKYGRVVRIAPNEVSIVDETAMRNLYGHGHNAVKTSWYNVWDPPGNKAAQMFSEQNKTIHAFLRKRVAAAYSMSSILKYEIHIQSCLDLLFVKLEKYAKQGVPVNMSDWTNAFAFDVLGELAYGAKLGHLDSEKDAGGLRATIFTIFKFLSILGHYPGQAHWVQNPLTDFLAMLLRQPQPLQEFKTWTESRVQHRLDNMETVDREDMLSHFCRMKRQDGTEVSLSEIVIEVINLIGAGADTTSIGIRNCLYFLAKSPKHYHQVQAEVDEFFEKSGSTEPISYLDTQKLPVLKAVIKEATRLRPSIVFNLPRHAPENFTVRGHYIPPGTPVGISPAAQNRDRDIWGDDADTFRPERFLESEERAKYLDGCAMTFGGNGPRMCVGKNIALVEMHKFIAQFIRNFDFEFPDPEKPWSVITCWFAFQANMQMNIRRRSTPPLRNPTTVL